MLYNLYVIRADGSEFEALNSPYFSREETAETVMTVSAVPGSTLAELKEFAAHVVGAELGAVVRHESSAIAFRTEEV